MDDANGDRADDAGEGADPAAALSGEDLVAHLVDVDQAGSGATRAEAEHDAGDDVEGGVEDGVQQAAERTPVLPGRALEQPDGGVVVSLGDWLSQVRRGRRVEALSVAMVEAETEAGSGHEQSALTKVGDADGSWSEDADGFVVEDRQDGSVVQTWVPAAVSRNGDVKAATARPPGGRRRRANVEGGRRHKHKVLVTPAEEAKLQVLSRQKRITIPRLLVEAAFAPDTQTVSERRQLVAQLMEFDRVVSGVAVNINQIARSTNTGYALPADYEATKDLLVSVLDKITEAIQLLNALNRRDLGE